MSDLVTGKYRALIEELVRRSEAGRVAWSEVPRGGGFQTDLGRYVVRLNESEEDFGPDYILSLTDDFGVVKDSFKDTDLSEVAPTLSGYDSYFELMQSLYRRAERAVSGADKALDDVLLSLGVSPIGSDDAL